jgi:hypothetical protein
MKKNRFITPEIEKDILHMIEVVAAKVGDITWAVIAENTGFTRASLSRNDAIQAAYTSAKSKTKREISDADTVNLLTVENAKLTKKLEKSGKIIEEFETKYITWIYNAQAAGLTSEKLNQPLPEGFKTTMRKKGK